MSKRRQLMLRVSNSTESTSELGPLTSTFTLAKPAASAAEASCSRTERVGIRPAFTGNVALRIDASTSCVVSCFEEPTCVRDHANVAKAKITDRVVSDPRRDFAFEWLRNSQRWSSLFLVHAPSHVKHAPAFRT